MIYNDDSCSACGGIRVRHSTLCADCLIRRYVAGKERQLVLQKEIDNRELRIGKLKGLCERLLDHIVNDRVSAAELATTMFERWKRKEKEGEDIEDKKGK